MMDNVKKILTNLGQPDPCVTLDEAIYQLAKQVQWKIFSSEIWESFTEQKAFVVLLENV